MPKLSHEPSPKWRAGIDERGAPTTQLMSGGRGRWNSTNRKDRAIMRILHAYGWRPTAIAEYVRFSNKAVTNVLGRRLIMYIGEDESQDYDFVDEVFRAKYPPRSPLDRDEKFVKREKKPKLDMVDVDIKGISSMKMNRSTPTPHSIKLEPSQRNRKPAAPPRIHPISRAQTSNAGPSASAARSSAKRPTNTYQLRPRPKPSTSRDDPIELDVDPPEVIEEPPHSVVDFLSKLDHDLSGLFATLKAQDLGKPEQLFTIASWPEQTLHRLFKEALPNITITQRFVLVKGLKDRVVEK